MEVEVKVVGGGSGDKGGGGDGGGWRRWVQARIRGIVSNPWVEVGGGGGRGCLCV